MTKFPLAPLASSPVGIAALAAAAVGMTLGHPLALILFRAELRRGDEPFVALTTGILCALIVLRAARQQTRRAIALSTFGWSLLGGAVNAGLAAQYHAFQRTVDANIAPFVISAVFGLFFAAPLSAAFALVNTALALGAAETRVARSHQSLDSLLGWAGAAVAAFGALRLAAAPDAWALLPIAGGGLTALLGFGRAHERRTWLRAVDRGEVPGLRIEILDEAPTSSLPCLLGRADTATSALVEEPMDEGHFRDARRDRQVALIDPW